jgi:hypothetical protein
VCQFKTPLGIGQDLELEENLSCLTPEESKYFTLEIAVSECLLGEMSEVEGSLGYIFWSGLRLNAQHLICSSGTIEPGHRMMISKCDVEFKAVARMNRKRPNGRRRTFLRP